MLLLLSRGLSEWALAGYIGAQRLGHKSRDNLLEIFIEQERKKWITNKGILCVHDKKYYKAP